MPRAESQPLRTCLGCRERRPQGELLRLRRGDDGVELDSPHSRGHGRGAYVCAKMECWAVARRRGAVSRALKVPVPESVQGVLEARVVDMISHPPRRGWVPKVSPRRESDS